MLIEIAMQLLVVIDLDLFRAISIFSSSCVSAGDAAARNSGSVEKQTGARQQRGDPVRLFGTGPRYELNLPTTGSTRRSRLRVRIRLGVSG